jgi:hypothetical protein
MLAKKHLPLWRARLYLWLEKVCFQRLALTFWLIEVLGPKCRRSWALEKRKLVNRMTRLWIEQLKDLAAHPHEAGSVGAF